MASDAGGLIVDKARELGAVAAGIASVELLKRSPSHLMLAKYGTKMDGEYSWDTDHDVRQVAWPADARSAVVIAVSHPRDKPELDWSCATGETLGNRRLVEAAQRLSDWVQDTLRVRARPMPYHVEEGGIYMKDAAVLAGLGCIGRNNIVISPEHGPRVRFRALLLDAELAPTGPIAFDPCRECDRPCRTACPQQAFAKTVLSSAEAGIDALPGRDGSFSRARCGVQLDEDMEDSGLEIHDDFGTERQLPEAVEAAAYRAEGRVRWCRRCELACPVGD
jgi:epoxyqueuosine reductase